MDKLKRLFHHEKKELVIIHPHLEPMKPLSPPASTSSCKKKKRFSLNLLQQKTQEPTERKRLAKSTSFLQLTQLLKQPTTSAIKSSQSMCFQDDTTCSSTTTVVVVNEDLIHTAAVSYPITTKYHEHSHNKRQIYLQLGIQFYEKGELDNASHYWKLSATEENEITPLGTFFYGLALLHGWGCRKSPAIAVRYLEKTVACNTVEEIHFSISQLISCDQLALSIYQLGESFWHGWEVPKNVATAVYYFKLAAFMGNSSAMNELGFCFQNGHGVTKDANRAAEWYRQAANVGTTTKIA